MIYNFSADKYMFGLSEGDTSYVFQGSVTIVAPLSMIVSAQAQLSVWNSRETNEARGGNLLAELTHLLAAQLVDSCTNKLD